MSEANMQEITLTEALASARQWLALFKGAERLTSLVERAVVLEQSIEGQEQALEKLNQELAAVKEDKDRLQKDFSGFRQGMEKEKGESIRLFKVAQKEIEAEVQELKEKVDAEVEGHRQRSLEQANQEIRVLRHTVTELLKEIGDLEKQKAALQTDIEAQEKKLADLEGKQQRVKEYVKREFGVS